MNNSENILQGHIQEYRRKFYVNKIIRGSIILALTVSSFLFVAILSEGLLGLSVGARTGLMTALGLVFAGVAGSMIFWPLLQLFQISRGITEVDIAHSVKTHFPEIEDKLLNLLQLRSTSAEENSLALAAIRKKTEELAPVPFARAINLGMNWRTARYLAIPLLLFLLIGIIRPDVLSGGSTRLLHFRSEFPKPTPFNINVTNHPGELIAGQEYELNANIDGRKLPAELYLFIRRNSESQFVSYPMDKVKADQFSFEFTDIKEDFTYFIGNEDVNTGEMNVAVFRRPGIRKFRAVLRHPAYTGLRPDTLPDNIGDVKVLKGTEIQWVLESAGDVSAASWMGAEKASFTKDGEGMYSFKKTVMSPEDYYISLNSVRNIQNIDTVRYHIELLQDRFPSVYVNGPGSNFEADHTMVMPMDFEISDDYGFSRLTLNFRFSGSQSPEKISQEYKEIALTVQKGQLLQRKELEVALDELGMEEGDVVEYFVKVWDNDYVTGPKASTSPVFTVNYASLQEKIDQADETTDKLQKELEQIQQDVKKVKEGYEKFQEKLLGQKGLSYDDKKEMKNLLELQSETRERMKSAQQEMEKNKEFMKNNSMVSQETLEKFEKLNEFMKQLQNPKFEEMMRRMEEMMKNVNPEELKKELEKMKMDEKEMEEAIKRTEELLKQLAAEQKGEEILKKLDEMIQREDMLNEKLEETKPKDEQAMKDLADRQEKLEKDMEQVQKDLSELGDMKKETETPDKENMDGLKQDAEDAKQNMDDAGQQMEQGDKKSGSQSQKNASQKMQDMKQKMESMMQSGAAQQDQQNLDDLRDLLENLLRLSFDQEDLRDEVRDLRANDPALAQKGQDQKHLLDDMYMLKDSLDALAQRVFQIEKFVLDESRKILTAMNEAKDKLDTKNTQEISRHQHEAMTSINNLANMLSDVMSQVQAQMKANQGQKSGSCNKPGGKNPNMKQLGDQQQKLNEMMKQMMGECNKPGGMNSKKLAEMAAQQEGIRKALKDAHDKIKQEGGKMMGDMGQVMEDMKQTEEELKQAQLTAETLERQQKILNRMLDSQRSVREKEQFENRRESNSADEKELKSPDQLDLEEYKDRLRQELLKSNQLEYSNEFIILIEKYFKLLEQSNGK